MGWAGVLHGYQDRWPLVDITTDRTVDANVDLMTRGGGGRETGVR